jgi:predicted nucleotidyltransferase
MAGFSGRVQFVKAVGEKAELEALPISAKDKECIRFAAGLLSAQGAKRVVLFGSLARGHKPTVHSDFDLAVEGLPGERYFECLGELLQRMPRPVDLVELELAPGFLRKRIEEDGIQIEIP